MSRVNDALRMTEKINLGLKRAYPRSAPALTRPAKSRHLTIIPGLLNSQDGISVSDTYANFLKDMYEEYVSAFPKSEVRNGVSTGFGVTDDGTAILTAAGFPMEPMGYPPIRFTDEHVPPKNARHLKILDEFLKAVASKWQVRDSVKIRKDASTGFPSFNISIDYKCGVIAHVLANLDKFLNDLSGDREKLLKDYDMMFAFHVGRRQQADSHIKPGEAKKREATDLLLALTGNGDRPVADRNVTQSSRAPLLQRTRSRLVYAGPGTLNYITTFFFSGIRDYYLNEFEHTYKLRGAEDLQSRMNGKYPVGVDVKQFDQNYPKWFRRAVFAQLRNVFDERFVSAAEKLWTSAVYCPPPSTNDKRYPGCWFGDPFDPSTEIELGLPSGVAYNPDVGKFFATFTLLCLLDDVFGDVLEIGISKILRHEHSAYAIMDTSDDAIILCESEVAQQRIRELLQSGEASPYLKFDVEEAISYLGWVPLSSGSTVYEISRNTTNYLVNWWCPEQSWGSRSRPFPATGYFGKQKDYEGVPALEGLKDIEERLIGKYLRVDFQRLMHAVSAKEQIGLVASGDAQVIANPEKLYYRDLDVSEDVLKSFFLTFPPELVTKAISPFVSKEALL